MNRRAARKDENHNEIESVFRTLLADHVTDSSPWGDGFGDLFVSFGGESGPAYCHVVEIKCDDKATLTAAQIKFQKRHPGCHTRVETPEQATALCGWIRKQVEKLQVRL